MGKYKGGSETRISLPSFVLLLSIRMVKSNVYIKYDNPEQIAGGNPLNIGGLRDTRIN